MLFTEITDGQIDAGSPGTTSLFHALRDNAYAIFSNIDVIEAVGAGTWTVPDNVTTIRVTVCGGGGGGRGVNIGPVEGGAGTAGGATRWGPAVGPAYQSTGGEVVPNAPYQTVALAGIANFLVGVIPGCTGYSLAHRAGDLGYWSNCGGSRNAFGSNSYGAGGRCGMWPDPSSNLHCPGGASAASTILIPTTPGYVWDYTVGAGGAGGAGTLNNGYDGNDGVIIVEW